MSQKQICPGDVCRIRSNESGHGFKVNTLVVIKECYPKFIEFPQKFKAASRQEWWYVSIEDLVVVKRYREKNAEY